MRLWYSFTAFFILTWIVAGLSPILNKVEAAYPLIQGSELTELAISLEALALGGASIGQTATGSIFLDNPAAGAASIRKDFSITSHGVGDDRTSFILSYLHPTDFGTFGLSSYASLPIVESPSDDFGRYFAFTAHFSKRLSRIYHIGFNLALEVNNIDPAEAQVSPAEDRRERATDNNLPVGFHFDAAFRALPQTDTLTSSGFSVRRILYGLTIRDIGLLPIAESETGDNLNSGTIDPLIIGAGFDFLTIVPEELRSSLSPQRAPSRGFTSRLVSEFRFSYPVNFVLQGGLANTFYFDSPTFPEFSILVGGFYNPFVDTFYPITGGLSFRIALSDTDFRINWVWLLETARGTSEVTGVATVLGFAFTFGYRDQTPPEIDPSIFSGEGFIEQGTFNRVPQ